MRSAAAPSLTHAGAPPMRCPPLDLISIPALTCTDHVAWQSLLCLCLFVSSTCCFRGFCGLGLDTGCGRFGEAQREDGGSN